MRRDRRRHLAWPSVLAGLCAAIAGCALTETRPGAPSGPAAPQPAPRTAPAAEQTASIADSLRGSDGRRAALFAVVAVDGVAVPNSFDASADASRAAGGALRVVVSERRVAARPLRVSLRAGYAPLPPGVEPPAEGSVTLTPRPGGRYVVRGELGAGRAAVWIEDLATGQVVTERVTGGF